MTPPFPRAPTLLLVLLTLAAAACAGSPGSRRFGLPDTEEAQACQDECADTRALCSQRPTAGDLVTDVTRPGPGSRPIEGLSGDERRHRTCEEGYERCVSRCPGAYPR